MDWRSMSRSRSRISMDWRPASRSRSRPPESLDSFDAMHLYAFPTSQQTQGSIGPDTFKHPSSKPSSVTSMLSATRRSPPSRSSELPSVFEENDEPRFLNNASFASHFNSPAFGPSSLPSFGLCAPPSSLPKSSDMRSFPRHVRKTSFDHTVTKDGILAGLKGRHQVNGKALAAESLLGTKRPADAPHAESMLRADPSDIDMSMGHSRLVSDSDAFEASGSFPSSSFDFSYGPYEGTGMFNLSHNASDYLPSGEDTTPGERFHSARLSMSGSTFQPSSVSSSESMAPGSMLGDYGLDEDGALDYSLMRMAYPNMNGSGAMSQNPYTHIDPTQILNDSYPAFQASPSSDGWNGVGSSSNASPEPYNVSTASTPPSTEGADGLRSSGRKFSSLRGNEHIRKKSLPGGVGSPLLGGLRSSTSTPDLSESHNEDGKGGDGESPTLCTNCQTTNTPLWRRDPEGQPLCA